MTEKTLEQDRRSGALLVSFVGVQLTYLAIQLVWMAPPVPSFHELGEVREFVQEHSVPLRAHTLITMAAFVFLLVPGSLGLRHRMQRSTADGSPWPDLLGAGLLLVIMSVFMACVSYAVLGVPGDPPSDSALRAALMDNHYSIMVVGSFALALFVGSASVAVLRSERAPRWLGWWGLLTAAATVAGTLWVVSAELDGPLYGLSLAARASFLAWLVATGIWMFRTKPGGQSASTT